MSKATDGHDLTRVGPGTVMGEMMRQYWIPAAASSELKPDGDPMRLMLLGEPLIAFRDSSGRVGVLDHQCPHRCASLFLGRNEENGIRCVYHGWKFDVDGRCLEMPNVPPPQDFKEKVRAKSYRVREQAGPDLGLHGRARRSAADADAGSAVRARTGSHVQPAAAREPTGCRASKATSTPRISASCTPVMSRPKISRKAIRPATPSPTARPSTRSAIPNGARCTAPTGPKRTARCIGAWRISACRSGRRRRTPISPIMSLRKRGCRWTTPTRC